jgi:hypothetical protein
MSRVEATVESRGGSRAGTSADFGTFLERSLALLAVEHPSGYRRLCDGMAGHAVQFVVDGRAVAVRFEPGRARVSRAPDARATTFARLDRATLLDLVDAVVSLPDAILTDRFHLRADLDDVVRFHDAFLVYLRGALRCPGFPALLHAYRAAHPSP